MRFASLVCLAGLASVTLASWRPTPRSYDTHDYYVLQLAPGIPPEQVASRLGLKYDGPLGEIDTHHIFSALRGDEDVVQAALKRRKARRDGTPDILDHVQFTQKQVLREPWKKRHIPPRHDDAAAAHGARQLNTFHANAPNPVAVRKQSDIMSELDIKDPIFKDQWHLLNTIQVGHDINVTGVWQQGLTGTGSIVAMVDDGLDMDSDDLRDNYYREGSYDFNDHEFDPKPRLPDDHHGTRCAGEIAAVRNNVCGLGVAYTSKISGLRILSKLITDADEAIALTYDYQHNQIYSCSWGPPDDGQSMEAPGVLIRQAMLRGIQSGRQGKGSIYVFASGNGAANEDNCNFDGYTNSIYSITIGAVDRAGKHPYYSEKCSAQLVVTYSSGSGDAIHTTDVGTNKCYSGHSGTSAAAPLAAGIFALVLQARPDLTWRDLQYLVMNTAVPVYEEGNNDWQDTAIGKRFSHTFGYGKIDTYGVVEAAKTWELVKPQAWYFSPWVLVNQEIPQGDQGVVVNIEITDQMLKEANLARLEHVTVTMNVNHTRRGDLSADLISPSGVISHISATRKSDEATTGYRDWTFMTVAHWGESGVGKWSVVLKDTIQNQHSGIFIDFHLKLWGESIDPSKTQKLALPQEDDDEHVSLPTTTPAPSDAVPSGTDDEVATPTGAAEETTSSAASPTSSPSSSWISWLPTFGVSSSAQVWIYGALGLIIVFCCGLGIYLFVARRRRLRNDPRNEYEFELLDEEEGEGLNGAAAAEKGVAGRNLRKGRKTRGGELYDAFAGGSDDEDFDNEYRDGPSDRPSMDDDRAVDDGDYTDEDQHVIGSDDSDADSDDSRGGGTGASSAKEAQQQQGQLLGSNRR